jgi:hypothetical protein
MMFCTKCGKSIAEDTAFCSGCGTEVFALRATKESIPSKALSRSPRVDDAAGAPKPGGSAAGKTAITPSPDVVTVSSDAIPPDLPYSPDIGMFLGTAALVFCLSIVGLFFHAAMIFGIWGTLLGSIGIFGSTFPGFRGKSFPYSAPLLTRYISGTVAVAAFVIVFLRSEMTQGLLGRISEWLCPLLLFAFIYANTKKGAADFERNFPEISLRKLRCLLAIGSLLTFAIALWSATSVLRE